MSLQEIISQIDQLQFKIETNGKFPQEILNRINYKFRLDWNYHSNSIEGNSLTKEETRSVMINNITIEGKPIKDVLEIRGHDRIVTDILKLGKGELNISEKRIKDIHKAIIHEDSPEQQRKVGEWKTFNNHLINYRNEKIEFVPHEQVQEEMHNLINWLNTQLDLFKSKRVGYLHPTMIAFQFHLKYVSIHPFYDGNGRTARVLMNLILISFGYPPVIVKVGQKNAYNQYLADIQAYGGSEELFLEFMGNLLIHSQKIVIDALEGKDINEPDDLDKKILLLEKELSAIDSNNEVKDRFSSEVFLKMYDDWISVFLFDLISVSQKFNKFFTGTNHYIRMSEFSGVKFVSEPAEIIVQKLRKECCDHENRINSNSELVFSLHYGTLIKGGLNTFGCNYNVVVKFDYIKYSIEVDLFSEDGVKRQHHYAEKLLHQAPTKREREELVAILGEAVYNHIDFNTKKNGIR